MMLAELNRLDEDGFVAAIGPVYEESPWIARVAAGLRPFASVQALYVATVNVLREAGEERQTALISAHPDLAGRLAREGRLTPASQNEQASAGLDLLTPEERAQFDALNHVYRGRFGFPFVICAREQTKASILRAMKRRVRHSRSEEIETALHEIEAIALLRLRDLVSED
jgi:2-oxo-4-hydroxy-4-carboxy-5-ureidoimidazoline decarboxylase